MEPIDNERADHGASKVARSAHDDHHPNGESDRGSETQRRRRGAPRGFDVVQGDHEQPTGESHESASEGERLELVLERVLPQGHRRLLVLSNRPQHPTPWRLGHEIED